MKHGKGYSSDERGKESTRKRACLFLKKDLFRYLFLDRGEGREKEREGNINV